MGIVNSDRSFVGFAPHILFDLLMLMQSDSWKQDCNKNAPEINTHVYCTGNIFSLLIYFYYKVAGSWTWGAEYWGPRVLPRMQWSRAQPNNKWRWSICHQLRTRLFKCLFREIQKTLIFVFNVCFIDRVY